MVYFFLIARPWAEGGLWFTRGLFFFKPRGHGPSAVQGLPGVYYCYPRGHGPSAVHGLPVVYFFLIARPWAQGGLWFTRGLFFLNRAAMGRARFKVYPGFIIINHAAMGRARFMVYPWFIFFNRAAMGRARFIIYPWFIITFFFVGDQTQTSFRPNFESRNV